MEVRNMKRLSSNNLNNYRLGQLKASEKNEVAALAKKIANEPQLNKIIESIHLCIKSGKIKDELEFVGLFENTKTAYQLLHLAKQHDQTPHLNKNFFMTDKSPFLKKLSQEVDNIISQPSEQLISSKQENEMALFKNKLLQQHSSVTKLSKSFKEYTLRQLEKNDKSQLTNLTKEKENSELNQVYAIGMGKFAELELDKYPHLKNTAGQEKKLINLGAENLQDQLEFLPVNSLATKLESVDLKEYIQEQKKHALSIILTHQAIESLGDEAYPNLVSIVTKLSASDGLSIAEKEQCKVELTKIVNSNLELLKTFKVLFSILML
jgi:hypothetical protein